MPTFEPARFDRIFIDNWESAGANVERCMRRAAEFKTACNATSPVTARYFLGKQLLRSETAR